MLSSKKHDKIEKLLGSEMLNDLEALDESSLKARIAAADGAIKTTQDELEANPMFLEIKEQLKALSEGLREVKKRQNSVVTYCLHLLEERA